MKLDFFIGTAFIVFLHGIWFPLWGLVDTSCRNVITYSSGNEFCRDLISSGTAYFLGSALTAGAIILLGYYLTNRNK